MSGVLIAEGRAVCRDPARDNCAAKTFILTPERDSEFATRMMGKIKDYDEAVNKEEKNKLIDWLCKDLNPTYTGERVTCCPDEYIDNYEEALYDGDGIKRGNSIGPDTLMNIGKVQDDIHMLCDTDTLAKCAMNQDELEKEGYETAADCIKKVCNEAGYRINFDKKQLCLVDNETDTNPSTDCPITCDIKELVEEQADYTVFIIGGIFFLIIVIAVIIALVYYLTRDSSTENEAGEFR
jgi:hypothetical protein